MICGNALGDSGLGALFAVLMAVVPVSSAIPCAQCHPKEVAGYSATPMAHSLGPPSREPSGTVAHRESNTHFEVESNGSHMRQRIEQNGITAEYQIAYAVGAGSHAIGYLVKLGDHLFQSPLCFFPERGWGLAPGYETVPQPDVSRPVTPACLACHSGQARPKPDTINSYEDPPFESQGITCERCHGPAEAHLRNPIPGSIVNPANLPQRARDSVCEQCHLNGEARITNPGKEFSDFRPGQNLEDVFSVYVFDGSLDPSHSNPFKVISQAHQLALSACSRMSHGKLWCGTCHDPHDPPPDPKAYFRTRCLSCHGAGLLKTHPKPSDDCVGCHMPHREVTDGAHTTFTDHRITRRPPAATAAPIPTEDRDPVAWQPPAEAFATRNLGLAEVDVGERLKSRSLTLKGVHRLLSCWDKFPDDPAVLTHIGEVLFNVGDYAQAAAVYERAILLQPQLATHYLHAGVAWRAAHDEKKAVEYLEQALRRDPFMTEAYRELAETYREANEWDKARETEERLREAFGKAIAARSGPRVQQQ